jgi:hypothetical protein
MLQFYSWNRSSEKMKEKKKNKGKLAVYFVGKEVFL